MKRPVQCNLAHLADQQDGADRMEEMADPDHVTQRFRLIWRRVMEFSSVIA